MCNLDVVIPYFRIYKHFIAFIESILDVSEGPKNSVNETQKKPKAIHSLKASAFYSSA